MPLPDADGALNGEVALLLHLDDLHPESLPLGTALVMRVVAADASLEPRFARAARLLPAINSREGL